MTKQEVDKRKAELNQAWKRLMEKDAEIGKVIRKKRAEEEAINKELENVEKEYGKLGEGKEEARRNVI